LETTKEKEEIEQKKPEIRKWTKEDKEEIGNIVDSYYKL